MRIARQLQLYPGSLVTIKVENSRMVIHPPKYDLNIMIENITPKNRHHLIIDDELHGKEEW
jgi:antitoxin component of MazEF toxin-antitoxin module